MVSQSAGLLSADFLKQRLDANLLLVSGLITAQTSTIWARSEPRIKTGMLYKQQKFNLLREETEGYSKLEIELLSNMGVPHDSRTARPNEFIATTRRRAEKTMNNIKALIGYFDLDPSRALDIILDVFADNILNHHVFFRQLLRLSPWQSSEPAEVKQVATNGDEKGKKSMLPDGSFESKSEGSGSVCAQILGFKFAWYAVCVTSQEIAIPSADRTLDRLARVPQKLHQRSCISWQRYSSGTAL